ncbi:MAG TPA: FAD:protein FMN transferase [Woeseiaceae bacterium]|nr:FAD:protein FMN transferase [Woeseiaceae bacterium]
MRPYQPATALLVSLMLAGCGNGEAPVAYELSGSAMGTRYSVTIAEPLTAEQRQVLEGRIDGTIDAVEQAMSTYIVESDVSRFNASRSTDWIEVSDSVCHAVAAAHGLSELTNGAFDITVGPLVNLWGFGPETVELAPPPPEEIKAAQARVGYQRVHADCSRPAIRKDRADVYIDLSAWAKGYAVDRVAVLLDDLGIENYLAEIGGELRMTGRNAEGKLWGIGIEKPSDNGRDIQMVIRLTDRAVSTSGDYRNYFVYEGQRYSHLIDGRKGAPVSHNLASVTVVADETAFADAMATALLVLGPDEGMELAVRENLAAYFQLRLDEGFAEKMSPAFEALVNGNSAM